MKVIFITPASDMRRLKLYRIGNLAYGHANSITGPLILGHILKEAGHQVEVYEELYADIDFKKLYDADVFCIYTMTCNAPRAYVIADMLKKDTHARVIIGGMHASVLPEEAAKHCDQVIKGEGEAVILDVVEGRLNDRIVDAKCLENLDDAPLPDYSLLKTRCDCANVLSTRGCPFCCSFCTTSRMYHPYRERSVENVIEELRYYKKLGFKYMNFEDDNFTANKARAKEICRRMIEEGLIFKETFFFGRTDMAKDEELLDILQKAHLSRALVGIESLNQASLDAVNKHQNISDIENCAEALARHKIRLIASIVLGIDTDTKEDIDRSVQFSKDINAYQLQPAVMTPFPGTAVYEQYVSEHRMLTDNWDLFDMMNVTYRPATMSPWELQKEFFRSVSRFYTFFSSFKIWKIFGANYGLRRIALSLIIKLGVVGLNLIATFGRHTYPYALKHMKLPAVAIAGAPAAPEQGRG